MFEEKKIQLFAPKFRTEECLEQIRECLDKGWTGLGFKTVEFEEKWKEYTGLKFAHYLNSSTMGLNLAVEVLKEENHWNDGDEIITTPLTFISTNHAILHSNMKAVFADIDEYLCLDPKDVIKKITPKTKAIMFVGIGGNVGRYEEIEKIAEKHNLKIILDAAHMAGTKYKGDFPGKNADVIVYSYQAVKNCPTGDSGMICFKAKKNDEIVRKKAWLGINKDTYARSVSKDGAYKWMYDVEYVGWKAHGNSIMASLALVSLKYLEEDNKYRRQIAEWYDEAFKGCDKIKLIPIPQNCITSRHLYQILIDNRDDVILALNKCGIFPGVHYRDNTEYRMYSYAKGTCPYSKYVSDHTLSLPIHLKMTKDDVDYIAQTLKNVLN